MDKRDGIWYDKYVGPLLGAALLLFVPFYYLSDEIGDLLLLFLSRETELLLAQGDGLH